jgi:hypothetical protein
MNDNIKQWRYIRHLAKLLKITADQAAMHWAEAGLAKQWRDYYGDPA